jgi:hypothetical protein
VPNRALIFTTALLVLGGAATLTACGGSSTSGTAAASNSAALAYTRCLRSHGVPNFPDPAPGGRLPNIPNDIDTAAPGFRSAQQACAALEPGTKGSPAGSQSWMPHLLAIANCIRRHGLQSFPDPTTSPPPPPPPGSEHGNAIGGPGAYLAFPRPSPALSRAEAACGFRIP